MLSDIDILARLRTGEDSLTEFKPDGVNAFELRKTLVAFANTTPESSVAVLLLGIKNGKEIDGVKNPDSLQKTVRKLLTEDCYPQISHAARVVEVGGKSVLAIMVSFSRSRPHFSGPAYVRAGSESVNATETLYEDLISSRHEVARKILQSKECEITFCCKLHIGGIRFGDNFLGDGDPAGFSSYHAHVDGCDSFVLRLKNKNQQIYAFSVNHIVIEWDVHHDRLKLRYTN